MIEQDFNLDKFCLWCGASYSLTGPGQKYCKACSTGENSIARRRQQNREYTQKRHLEYPEKYLLGCIQSRCKEKNIPFNLELSDIIIPNICPVLGIPLFRNIGGKRPTGNSPSCDRIDPVKGYIKGNIQIISHRANVMKNDANSEELLKFADWVYKNYKNN